ncbi:MAG: hypothetical protein HON43_05960 [Alphaproteobacteria bacterium]|jgi:hypothetical protein|nr:hypothetical protein [Alphaproteobacteria bacterium]MBT5390292.1 hypothetical protein [Alphaproteobacteria bacterium]
MNRLFSPILGISIIFGVISISSTSFSIRNPDRGHDRDVARQILIDPENMDTHLMLNPYDTFILIDVVKHAKTEGRLLQNVIKNAKKHERLRRTFLDKMESSIGYREQVLPFVVKDTELVDMIMSDYAADYPKTASSITTALSE